MLNSASRTICGVGRKPGWTVTVTFRPRREPATMRISVFSVAMGTLARARIVAGDQQCSLLRESRGTAIPGVQFRSWDDRGPRGEHRNQTTKIGPAAEEGALLRFDPLIRNSAG